MGWHYRGVGTDICYAWEPQPSESSGPRAKGGRQGSGHLSRGWDSELTSELSLGHPFRASKACLGLWVVLGRQGSPRAQAFGPVTMMLQALSVRLVLLPIRIIS